MTDFIVIPPLDNQVHYSLGYLRSGHIPELVVGSETAIARAFYRDCSKINKEDHFIFTLGVI